MLIVCLVLFFKWIIFLDYEKKKILKIKKIDDN